MSYLGGILDRVMRRDTEVLLDRELGYWEANRDNLIRQYPNKWLLITGDKMVCASDTHVEVAEAAEAVDVPLIMFASTEEPTINLPSVFIDA